MVVSVRSSDEYSLPSLKSGMFNILLTAGLFLVSFGILFFNEVGPHSCLKSVIFHKPVIIQCHLILQKREFRTVAPPFAKVL